MFLGGPSLNKGIVAAFEKVLKRPVLVPKHREVMGAFGAALSVWSFSKSREWNTAGAISTSSPR